MTKFVVVDEILDQLEAAKSGVVPGSVTQSVVSGIQNVPTSIVQKNLAAGGSCFTTVPLSPIIKNCCIDKTYLNLEFDCNLKVSAQVTNTKHCIIPFYIGFRDSSAIFNQIQILIENSALTTTVYHREESVIAYNSLPETEIRGNNQYSSIEKMQNNKYSPMKRVELDITGGAGVVDTDIVIHYKLTVDINRLCPLLSNLHYTTPHFGNLRLKVWLQRIQEAMFFCPDYNYACLASTGDAANQPLYSQYWSFYPLSTYLNTGSIPAAQIPFYAYNYTDSQPEICTSFKFAINNNDFITFANSGVFEIVQTNFDIKEDEYARLNDYFASTGSIIIPTQTFDTGVFNNSTIEAGGSWNSTMIGSIGGYNVNFISTWAHPQSQATCFMNDFLKNIQLILDGRPVNALPYMYVNDKCIVDCTQAIIDTDHEEINADYIASLSAFNKTDTSEYMSVEPSTYYNRGSNYSIGVSKLSNPNTYALNFSTNLPDAFHSGACILETSNRNGVIRLNSLSSADDNTNFNTAADNVKFPFTINHKSLINVCTTNGNNTDSTVVGFTAFCDCCIVLTYDAARGVCFDGQLSWSAPYI